MATPRNLADYLLEIKAEDAQFGDQPQPPATSEKLATLRQQVREKFGYILPEGYLSLLSLSDGVNFNSYTLYASTTFPITGHHDRLIEGFVEANDSWGDYQANSDHHLLVFGETGDDLYLFDRRDQKFKVTDKVGGDTYQEFTHFEAFAERLFRDALGLDHEDA